MKQKKHLFFVFNLSVKNLFLDKIWIFFLDFDFEKSVIIDEIKKIKNRIITSKIVENLLG